MLWHALTALAHQHGRRLSWRDLARHAAQVPEDVLPEVAAVTLKAHGLQTKLFEVRNLAEIQPRPALLRLGRNGWALWLGQDAQGARLQLFTDHNEQTDPALKSVQVWPLAQLAQAHDGLVITAELQVADAPADEEASVPARSDWFWPVFQQLRAHYGECVVAALLVNLLGLAGSMFSMNVYDRIIPNAAMHSLWALAIGVFIAAVMEFALRSLRAHLLDDAGKRADLVLSAAIFRQTLRLRADQRPASSAQWASQIRDFESVRDFVSSTTLVALTDLPLSLLFFAVMFWMGGQLVWVPAMAAVCIVLFGLISQWPIRRSVQRYQYENTQKHALLIESLERLETIQALGAESAMQGRWERVCASTARSAMGSRLASAVTLNASQWIQQISSTGLIVLGVYLILTGQLTVGALIGCSILAGRALSPLGQVAGLLARWQHTKTAFQAVDKLMRTEVQHSERQTFVGMTAFKQSLALHEVKFSFPRSDKTVLSIDQLQLQRGQITAVMGPVGSGKSTLLRVLAGLYLPTQGAVRVDGLNLSQISPADWRAQVAWVSQDAVLFRGSLRENLLWAAPRVSDQRFIEVIRLCGLDAWIQAHPQGLDMPLGEGGQALSGGQRQLVALARALLAEAPILLLDEPTSAMDMAGEKNLLQRLLPEMTQRLVVIATHRPGPLELASRLIILDQGQVVADGPRDDVLQHVTHGHVVRAGTLNKPKLQEAA